MATKTKTMVRPNQTIWDLALQQHGSIAAVFEVSDINKIGINEDLEMGRELFVSDTVASRTELDYYRKKNIYPASLEPVSAINQPGSFNGSFNLSFD